MEEEEAASLAGWMRHSSLKVQPGMRGALMLLADQLQTNVDRDPFTARRFSISVEPRRTRQ